MFLIFLLVFCVNALSNYHESYSGKRISEEEYKQYVKQNTSFWCTNEILPCNPQEGRRLDGSCNNLKYYTVGSIHTPQYRILPPEYTKDSRGFEPKLTKRGDTMPLPRSVRSNMLLEGHLPDTRFTQLLTHFIVYVTGDFLSVHDTAEGGANSVLGTNLFTIWTWRYHNMIANALSAVNPCWSDERLFFTTREITIATTVQIVYYEAFALLMGRDNLINEGVLSPHLGFRDIYNKFLAPQISLEFPFVLRWLHTIQEGILRLYDENGNHLRDDRVTNMTLRTGYLVDNLPYVTQGAIRQPSAKLDYAIDPDMAQTVLTTHQRASDVFTSDLTKNRYFFFPSYVKYREYCFGKKYRRFKDLEDAIDPERLELLKEKYKDVEDIDLIVGIWLEKLIPNGYVPATFYCVSVLQLIRFVASDRHWYERPNRPNAFNIDQLLEIRKSTIAGFMCAVGDTVTEIQPQAFLRAGPGNEIQSCDTIDKLNINAWYDPACRIPRDK